MTISKTSAFLIAITGVLTTVTVGIIAIELRNPGTCPRIPFADVPACYVMAVVFFWMFTSNFLESSSSRKTMMVVPGALALTLSSFFSTQQLLGYQSCPQFVWLPIPLCYTVPPIVVLMMYVRVLNESQPTIEYGLPNSDDVP